jgi:hypothetical protein
MVVKQQTLIKEPSQNELIRMFWTLSAVSDMIKSPEYVSSFQNEHPSGSHLSKTQVIHSLFIDLLKYQVGSSKHSILDNTMIQRKFQ